MNGRVALPPSLGVAVVVIAFGVGTAIVAPYAFAVALALLPLWLHVRLSGGVHEAVRPTPASVVLAFYPFFFPVAALGVTVPTDEYGSILEHVPTAAEVRPVLFGVTAAMSAFVVAYHRTKGARRPDPVEPSKEFRGRATILAGIVTALALLGLALVVRDSGSLAGVTERYATHSKAVTVGGAGRLGITLWSTFSVLAGWCATVVVADRHAQRARRIVFATVVATVIVVQVLVFASRLYPILTLVGAWVLWVHLGHRIRPAVFVLAAVVALVGSAQLLEWRTLGRSGSATSYNDYTRLAGYSVLETIAAVRQRPTNVHDQLADPERWRDGPLYLLPRTVRPGIPDLERRRLDGYIANALGDPNQRRTTGFPASFVMELWLLGGWALAVVGGAAFGAFAGAGNRLLLRFATVQPAGALLLYAHLCAFAFTYFKDGDLLVTGVNGVKGTLYVAVLLAVTGLLATGAKRRHSRVAVRSVRPARRPA